MKIDITTVDGTEISFLTYKGKMIYDDELDYVVDEKIYKTYIKIIRYGSDFLLVPKIIPQYYLFDKINYDDNVVIINHLNHDCYGNGGNSQFTLYFKSEKDFIKTEKQILKLKLK